MSKLFSIIYLLTFSGCQWFIQTGPCNSSNQSDSPLLSGHRAYEFVNGYFTRFKRAHLSMVQMQDKGNYTTNWHVRDGYQHLYRLYKVTSCKVPGFSKRIYQVSILGRKAKANNVLPPFESASLLFHLKNDQGELVVYPITYKLSVLSQLGIIFNRIKGRAYLVKNGKHFHSKLAAGLELAKNPKGRLLKFQTGFHYSTPPQQKNIPVGIEWPGDEVVDDEYQN